MSDRKATNKYYPPEWNPSKGSINKFRNSHPLRDRARMLDRGILIVRFEMPYNIWCSGCENHIGMGVRYNAQKSKIGMYHTTPVYQFRMKCHLCDNHFILKTDPANLDYEIAEGARRQERRWDQAENGQIEVDKSLKQKLMLDPMFKLEHALIDQKKSQDAKSSITSLTDHQEERWADDYATNCALRNKFRARKKGLAKIAVDDTKLLCKSSLPISMPLVAENKKDAQLAKALQVKAHSHQEEIRQLKQKRTILNASIFGSTSKLNSSLLSSATSTSGRVSDQPRPSNAQSKRQKVILSSDSLLSLNKKVQKSSTTTPTPATTSSGIVDYSDDDDSPS